MESVARPAPVPIVALDFPTLEESLDLVERLGDTCDFYKVGSALYTAVGPRAVKAITAREKRVFLDLKFHDIPQTVESAAASAARLGASLITVHATGGAAMLHAAVNGAGEDCGVLAVTVLTSLEAEDVSLAWGRPVASVESEVVRLARLAEVSGAHGVVCSGNELVAVRKALGTDLAALVPGIRFSDGARHDQRRVVTPGAATLQGATYLVIGRPVSGARDPALAMQRVLDEIAAARSPLQRL